MGLGRGRGRGSRGQKNGLGQVRPANQAGPGGGPVGRLRLSGFTLGSRCPSTVTLMVVERVASWAGRDRMEITMVKLLPRPLRPTKRRSEKLATWPTITAMLFRTWQFYKC